MFPIVDQNRHDSQHQTVHVHMHQVRQVSISTPPLGAQGKSKFFLGVDQVCACMYPFYASYRPPVLAPYHLQPLPRPYNMHHYQYTQFNVSPFNMPPVLHAGAAPVSQAAATLTTPSQQQSVSQPLDFGPPPRDRRTFETAETGSQEAVASAADVPKENQTVAIDEFGLAVGLGDVLQPPHEYDTHNVPVTVETFTKFLEQGCIIAEKIAIRNQHRPCFKNIQNLCNRTRSEILKPSNTVSNIHSQGIPWATKDFIYAYVRLINCWHMLKGYLESKDGTLGNIDRELTPEFKNCYIMWEKSTKLLAGHMIRIFTNLDNNVSNPNAIMVHKAKMPQPPENSATPPQKPENLLGATQSVPQLSLGAQQKFKEATQQRAKQNSVCELLENVLLSESTTSPHDEDSDNESRVYMKPGSYNVPKKGNGNANNDSSNSSPSIEFFDTAQNVSAHYKKIAKRKDGAVSTPSNDKIWQDAQSAVPYLMNKINQPNCAEAKAPANPCDEIDENALKYFVDLNTLEHHAADIQEWLNSSNFFENQNGADNNPESPLAPPQQQPQQQQPPPPPPPPPPQDRPVTVLQRTAMPAAKAVAADGAKPSFCRAAKPDVLQTRTYRKRGGEAPEKTPFVKAPGYRKCCSASVWEHDGGGLTGTALVVLDDIVKVLEKEGLPKWIGYGTGKDCLDHPTSLATVRKKLNGRKYGFVSEFVRDIKNLLSCAEIYYEAHPEVLQQLRYFQDRLETLLGREFSAFDFTSVDDKTETLGPLLLKANRRSDAEGDL